MTSQERARQWPPGYYKALHVQRMLTGRRSRRGVEYKMFLVSGRRCDVSRLKLAVCAYVALYVSKNALHLSRW